MQKPASANHRKGSGRQVSFTIENKRLNRFGLRGKKKVQCQWQLHCLVHNIEKLANYGQLVA